MSVPKADPRLRPCPFCGGWAYIDKVLRDGCKDGQPDAWAFFAMCNSCGAQGGWCKSTDPRSEAMTAVRQWNWRHGDVALFAKVVDDEPDTVGQSAADLVAEYGEAVVRPYLRLIEASVREAKAGIKARLKALAAGDS